MGSPRRGLRPDDFTQVHLALEQIAFRLNHLDA
jgi:hypothetical protein